MQKNSPFAYYEGAGDGSGNSTLIELFSTPSQELFDLLDDGKKLARGLAVA